MEAIQKELVYSCSGCSTAAQTANAVAFRTDRTGAEMSYIAGVGGEVDPLHWAKNCLKRDGVIPDRHYDLSTYGIKKFSMVTCKTKTSNTFSVF